MLIKGLRGSTHPRDDFVKKDIEESSSSINSKDFPILVQVKSKK